MRHVAVAAGIALSLASAARVWGATLQAVPIVTGLTLPTYVTGAPGDFTHLYILEQGTNGTAAIKVHDLVTHSTSTFLTLTNIATVSEEGLLGMAFDPNYTSNGNFYLNYVETGGAFGMGVSKIVEYHANSPTQANAVPLGTLLSFDQPQQNHNGGWIGFSPRAGDDHNLYIATGDGGNSDDSGTGHVAGGNAQSKATLLGKMLRIHVNATSPTYSIPSNNPFVANPTVSQEIFAYGLRNPFRNSFDRATGTLYIGDVGQDNREELDVQKASNPSGGENYGWRLREGTISTPTGGVGGSPPADNVEPILDYAHATGSTFLAGQTIIGGYVYRGSEIPDLVGTYIFGDYLGPENVTPPRSEIFSLKYDGTSVSAVTDLTAQINTGGTPLIGRISSFGEDTAGDLYIVDITGGKVFKITAVPEPESVLVLGVAGLLLGRRRTRVKRASCFAAGPWDDAGARPPARPKV